MPPERPDEWEEEGKWASAAQAAFLVVLFFGAVVFGADLSFSRKPAHAAAVVSFVPAPVAPAPKPAPKPEPAPEPAPEPEPQKPDEHEIALKKKAEQKRKEEEEKKKKAAEEKKRKEKERKEKERKEKERKEKEKRERKEREEKERRDKLAEEQRAREKAAADAAAANAIRQGLINGYMSRIKSSIEPFLITPQEVKKVKNVVVVVEVNLNTDGSLAGIPEVGESSGFSEYDSAAVRAVLQAAPLPMPKDPDILEDFRNLRLHISPE